MNIPTTWSFSRWSTWDKCPFAYKAKFILKLPDPPTPAMARGDKVHKALDAYLNGRAPMPEEVKDPYQRRLLEELATFDRRLVEQKWGFTHNWRQTGFMARDVWLRSICDVALPYADDTVEVIDWKGLALDTPLPTPDGFTTMGAVQVGDFVMAPSGKPVRVVGKSEVKHLPCYEVSFVGHTAPIVCDHEHLWKIWGAVMPVTNVPVGGYIPHPAPLDLPAVELPTAPYVLGAWLGDSHKRDRMISKPDAEVFAAIEACGYEVLPVQPSSVMGRRVQGLRGQLAALGVLDNKHIPQAYLRASISQRIELLRGLMDTDGTWNKPRRRAVFTSTDPVLVAAVTELVASLGERPTVCWRTARGFGLTVQAAHVEWSATRFNPFTLPRKRDQVVFKDGERRGFVIQAVEQVPSVPTQCISVEGDEHMYLVGPDMVPTCNTGKRYGSNDEQMELFALTTFARFGQQARGGVTTTLVYLDSGQEEKRTFTCDEVDGMMAKWNRRSAEMLADRRFIPRAGCACRWCEMKKHGEIRE